MLQLDAYKKHYITIIALFAGLVVFSVLSIGIGPVSIEISSVLKVIAAKLGVINLAEDELVQSSAIVFNIRLPRVIMAILVGAALSVSGASLQGLFRNPLADPTLIGVSSGAALFAAAVIIFAEELNKFLPDFIQTKLLFIAAFLGGLVSTYLVYIISSKRGRTNVSTMLLAGIAINAMAAAGIGFLIFTATDAQIRDLTFWTLGSLGGSVWDTVFTSTPFLLTCILILPTLAKKLNAMLLGENEARYLGVNTEFVKRLVIVLAALGVGAAVATSGIIGFIGLVVPHLLRLIIGSDHRFLMPASILLGALLLLGSDLFARMAIIPAELPIGIVTSAIGAPFFLWLLMRNRAQIHPI